jgi:hypothetical protein
MTTTMQRQIHRIAVRRLRIDREFARSTILINKFLRKFNLHICKDCQVLVSNFDSLRCKDCQIEHDDYRREEAQYEAQEEEYAEREAYENDRD